VVDDHQFHKRWTQAHGFAGPHLRIPFRFIEEPFGFTETQEAHIRDGALAEITNELGGCIEFYDDTKTKIYNNKYIVFRQWSSQGKFIYDGGCSSAMGMVLETWGRTNSEGGKYQEINLGPGCLPNHNTIQHETYHALGFAHEQNRNDRDNHITVHYNNIPETAHVWYNVMGDRWLDSGDPYDLNSVMHYGGIMDAVAKKYSMTVKGRI